MTAHLQGFREGQLGDVTICSHVRQLHLLLLFLFLTLLATAEGSHLHPFWREKGASSRSHLQGGENTLAFAPQSGVPSPKLRRLIGGWQTVIFQTNDRLGSLSLSRRTLHKPFTRSMCSLRLGNIPSTTTAVNHCAPNIFHRWPPRRSARSSAGESPASPSCEQEILQTSDMLTNVRLRRIASSMVLCVRYILIRFHELREVS